MTTVSSSSIAAILVAFAAYLLFMIVIGAICMRRTNSSEDYFLGGRGLNAWVAALSAQASDMSGWLLMGLPGSIYALGTGQAWIAIGLFLGTVCNWLLISKRLRRYTIVAGNSMTLPEFLENRFHDKKKVLLSISSVVIIIFFLVYTASALASGGKLFHTIFGIDYHIALIIGAAVILTYTFMGGFLAVCTTDFVQGMLMLVGLLTVPIIAFALVSGKFAANIDHTQVAGGYDAYMNLFMNGGRPYKFVEILSQLAWGLGYCGMPHILIRFMAVKDEKELKKSSVIAISWCFLSLVAACFIGIVGRAYLVDNVLTGGQTESVFITMIERVFTKNIGIPFVGGLFLCGILAAIMSTADSQLLVCASSVSKDIYKSFIRKDADDKRIMKVTRITVIVVALIAIVIAWDPESSIMGLVSDAWAGLGSAFGPAIVLALFWKRANMPGTVVGIITGGLTVLIWDYIPLMGGKTLAVTTGIYSLLIGFILSLFVNVIVSLSTKAPSAEIVAEFEKVDAYSE